MFCWFACVRDVLLFSAFIFSVVVFIVVLFAPWGKQSFRHLLQFYAKCVATFIYEHYVWELYFRYSNDVLVSFKSPHIVYMIHNIRLELKLKVKFHGRSNNFWAVLPINVALHIKFHGIFHFLLSLLFWEKEWGITNSATRRAQIFNSKLISPNMQFYGFKPLIVESRNIATLYGCLHPPESICFWCNDCLIFFPSQENKNEISIALHIPNTLSLQFYFIENLIWIVFEINTNDKKSIQSVYYTRLID